MRRTRPIVSLTVAALAAMMIAGCAKERCRTVGAYRPAPLGAISDPIWQEQEANAEASDFVVHEHEFVGNSARLNHGGEEHVKQIAVRAAETPFPVLVEPSSMTARPQDKYGFPVHGNDELDLARRQVIVNALASMGVDDAEDRVVVSPALVPGFEEFEAERAYNRGFGGYGIGRRGFGGFFGGGFGGLGGFGGF